MHCAGRETKMHTVLLVLVKETWSQNATFVFLCANEQNYKFHRSLVLITVEVLKQLHRDQQ